MPSSTGPRGVGALAALGVVAVVAAGTLAGLSAPPASADTVIPQSGLLAEYLFDETSGSTVPNTAAGSVGAATVVNGTNAQWTGSSLVFAGGAKTSTSADWVRLPDNILTGKDSASITIETKFDASMASSFNFLWNIGNDSTTSYYFASVRDKVRTAITTASAGGEVNARATESLSANRWYSLTSVIDGAAGTISFYVDGAKVSSTPTALKPSSITNQSLNAIGRSPWPDPFYKGEVSTFRVYDRALSAAEVAAVSTVDAGPHASTFTPLVNTILDGVAPVTADDSQLTLPNYGGAVRWSSTDPALTVAADGTSLTVAQPAPGSPAVTGSLTATANVRGVTASRTVPVTIEPVAAANTPYGYMMVHFIEDSAGYAEKIYLDVSRGDDPEKWDRLNGGNPILASDLGTTGVRDPYLTYNPETGTYYIIATDLRVFGGDAGSGSCTTWCYWTTQGSTKINVWSSTDLVSWSDLRQFDVALDAAGQKAIEAGMMWAPEATWVDDFDGQGNGRFVLYWSSTVYGTAAHTPGTGSSRVLWGSTTDFTQASYSFGGTFIYTGGDVIDTTLIQDEGTTYRISKDNSTGKGIYMESTTAAQWWLPTATWTQRQTQIGAVWAGGNAGGVEGPAVFKDHDEDTWYLYVDVIPSTGYKPMSTHDLAAGWTQLTDPGFSLAPSTKHGGIVSLTKAQYDTVRAADAASVVTADLGSVASVSALPATAQVNLAYGRGTATQPVTWNTASVGTAPGTYPVTGTVRTIGANKNQWVGAGGSTAYNASGRVLSSSTALTVTARVVVTAPAAGVTVTAATKCIAGSVYITAVVKNTGTAAVAPTVTTAYGSKALPTLAPGATASAVFTTRAASVPAGSVTASVPGAQPVTAPYPAATCG
ncbi:hypothetical protein HQQ80_19280 [Microbacteriaceae bacterium VKM Ac-2855]|nr:hypothetical protein [Microbacteriaceae bacterium VKM Ac-2855]